MNILTKSSLNDFYIKNKYSVKQIAKICNCSENKINYWIKKFGIPKRTISQAIYNKHNPKGDPFKEDQYQKIINPFLFGLGLGLYWGEGNKNNKYAVRLGNTDPNIILNFIRFLEEIYSIDRNKLRFGIQIFNTMNSENVLEFWLSTLNVSREQFYKTTITPSRGEGTYKKKITHGVLTVYFNNKKLRNIICHEIENLRRM